VRRQPAWRWAAALLGLLVAVNVALRLFGEALGSGPAGPPSSSYATSDRGLGAYYELLRRSGHRVARVSGSASDAPLDPSSTVVMIDPDAVLPRDVTALRAFLHAGGRLVAGGAERAPWLDGLLSPAPTWAPGGSSSLAPAGARPEAAGVRQARSAGEGRWREAGRTEVALRTGPDPSVLVAGVGGGHLALLADGSPLQNRLLDAGDNAQLGLDLAGAGRRVVFLEGVHGYGRQRGLAALPAQWRLALLGLALAVLALMAACGRRLGPPERDRRALPPPRRAYVDAMAATLARTRSPGAAAGPVQAAARERVAARGALGPEPDADAVDRAAARFGLSEAERNALRGPVRDDDELLAAGRALARMEEGR